MKKILTVFVLCAAISCATTKTDNNGHVASVRPAEDEANIIHEYLIATKAEANIIKFQQLMNAQIKNEMKKIMFEQLSNVHFEDKTKETTAIMIVNGALENFTNRFEEERQKLMPFNELEKKIYVPVIKEHFTPDELETIIAFYNTPVGEKYVATLDTIMQEITAKTNQEYGGRLREMTARIAKEELGRIMIQINELMDQ